MPSISSSAPSIFTLRPPSPTLDDPYLGFYQLPSGAYAPYEAECYASYARKWQAEYDNHIRALEKVQYNPATEGVLDVDMAAEMEKARQEIQEREERKADGRLQGRCHDRFLPVGHWFKGGSEVR